MFLHLLGLGVRHTAKGVGSRKSGEQIGFCLLGVCVKMGGGGEGHPISHVLLPALVTQGMSWKLSHGREILHRLL